MAECKHKFMPRYSKKWSTALKDIVESGIQQAKHVSTDPYLQEETYIHDICVKCGTIKSREKQEVRT